MKNIKVYIHNKIDNSVEFEKMPYIGDCFNKNDIKYKIFRISTTFKNKEKTYRIYAYAHK